LGYRRFQGDVGHIGLLDLQQGIPLEILYSNMPDSGVHSFCWEPDGMHFLLSMKTAYSDYCDLYRGYIYGGQLENITNTPSQSEQYPMYSNNGSWIVYSILKQGTSGYDIALWNVQTQWDTVIYNIPYDQTDFCWCADDTMFAFESPLGGISNLYFYRMNTGTIHTLQSGQDICFSPTGRDFLWSIATSYSNLWVYYSQIEVGPYNPYNLTSAYPELDGLLTDPDWHPTYEAPTVIFLHKHQQGNRWLGNVWMLFDCMPVQPQPEVVPLRYHVGQPYPNPFNASTTLPLELNSLSFVQWELYNILGQRIIQMTPGTMQPGIHRIVVDGDDLSTGNYWVVVNVDGDAEVRKLVLLK
jgi:hypothetical protein